MISDVLFVIANSPRKITAHKHIARNVQKPIAEMLIGHGGTEWYDCRRMESREVCKTKSETNLSAFVPIAERVTSMTEQSPVVAGPI